MEIVGVDIGDEFVGLEQDIVGIGEELVGLVEEDIVGLAEDDKEHMYCIVEIGFEVDCTFGGCVLD